MKFTAKVVDPNSVVVRLSIELDLQEAGRLIGQLDQIKDGAFPPWPASTVRDGLAGVGAKVGNQVGEELVAERSQG